MRRYSKWLMLVLALVMMLSAFSGCKNTETPETPDTDDKQDEQTDTELSKYPDAGKIIITDTFYPQYPEVGEYDEMKAKLKKWFDDSLENGNLFSAKVGDEMFNSIFPRMIKDIKRETNADGDELINATFTDEQTHIMFTLEATLYGHSPSVDYSMRISNTSETENTDVISELYSLNSDFEMKSNYGFTVHTNEGSHESLDDFLPIEDTLKKSDATRLYDVSGGSSSNGQGFPFFDVIGKNEGVIMAIGHSGDWESDFSYISNDSFNMRARQKIFNAALLPGESIRMPSIVLTYFTGDEEYGHNIWRRLMISDYTPPTDDPEGFKPPLCASTWGRSAEKIKEFLPYYKDSCVELFFIDAGWHSQDKPINAEGVANIHVWHEVLGDWSQSKKLYPNGLREVADFVHDEMEMKFMLWWMIEDGRIGVRDDWTFDEKYYFMTLDLPGVYNPTQALNLANDETADMLIEYFSDYIENHGIDAIRLDKSTFLDYHWRLYDNKLKKQDGVERQGITEAKYVENFYRIWDTLYEKYPGRFFLDNCSSGGRRIDIEMTKRGYPLWRTDKNGDNDANQAMTQYLAKWLPLNNIGNLTGTNEYADRSKYSATNIIGISSDPEIAAKKLEALEEFEMLRPYWYGDYYQLLPENRTANAWQSYMLYREDWQKGMFVVIRRAQAKMERETVTLKGLMPDREYKLHNIDDEGTENDIVMTGKELMENGIEFAISSASIDCYLIELVRNETDVIR